MQLSGGNFPRWELYWGQLPEGIIVWEAIALGGYCPGEGEQLLGGNCPVSYLTLIFEKNLKVLITQFKVRLSPFKKICVVCLIESPLEMMKNAFSFILKALLKIFKFLSRPFGHLGKTV